MNDKPSPYDLWVQSAGDRAEYRRLLREHGLLIPLKPGEAAESLPCGWPHRRKAKSVSDEEAANGA